MSIKTLKKYVKFFFTFYNILLYFKLINYRYLYNNYNVNR